jgi:hypothetical protein
MIPAEMARSLAALTASAGLGDVQAVKPLVGGANNRVFRVEAGGGVALLKAYFRHPDDPRDRQGTEFAFARYAWAVGVRSIPRPLACDAAMGLGLFEFVPGRRLETGEVDGAAVDQALAFFRDLNRDNAHPDAKKLPLASEACFSLAEHLACIDRRVRLLAALPAGAGIDEEARAFVREHLVPAWRDVAGAVQSHARAHSLALDEPLGLADRCLSPSDFGYHNALLAPDGRLRFVDFEYAGWDDPAKLICDFFCQPAIPAPPEAYDHFARTVAALLPRSELHRLRAAWLLPAYRIKWGCIVLNDFLPVGGRRRQFAGTAAEQQERKVRQLGKARQALAAFHPDQLPARRSA